MALAAAACSREPAVNLHCEAGEKLGNALRQEWTQQAINIVRQTAAHDVRQFLDASKAEAAIVSLTINYSQPQAHPTQQVCQTQMHIHIPDLLWQGAKVNAPLWGGATPEESFQQRLMGSMVRWEKPQLILPVSYVPQGDDLVFRDTDWSVATKAVMSVAAPYAMRDVLNINGTVMTRIQALQQLSQPASDLAGVVAPTPAVVQEIQEVQAIDDTNLPVLPTQSHQEIIKTQSQEQAIEIIKPEDKTAPAFHPDDLHEARRLHAQAEQALKQTWQQIDPEIRQMLHTEQQQWEQQKAQDCRRTTSKSQTQNQSDYLYAQCDTRMTRERVQYLRGYGLPQ